MDIVKKAGNFGYPRSAMPKLDLEERPTVTFTSYDRFMIFTVNVDLFGGHKNNNLTPYGENPTSDHD